VNASQNKQERIRHAISAATLPYKFAPIVRGILRETPEYEEALADGVAKAWLEQESDHICAALAAVVRDQLERLDPYDP
jgi:hypothetical protein